MKFKLAGTILMSAVFLTTYLLTPPEAVAKKWTVTERIQKLSKEIDEGRAANELTSKQVEALKNSIDDIKTKMEKMKEKNGGKISVPDTKKLHDEMTALSVKIYKQRMDNVYAD